MIDIVKICSIFRASFTLKNSCFIMATLTTPRRPLSPLRAEALRLAAQANAALRPTLKIR